MARGGHFSVTVEVKRNRLPEVIRRLPRLLDDLQHDLVDNMEEATEEVIPIGEGYSHETRLILDATLLQRTQVRRVDSQTWELYNDAEHAFLVYYGNPLSPPRPWFEWALNLEWDWYRAEIGKVLREIQRI